MRYEQLANSNASAADSVDDEANQGSDFSRLLRSAAILIVDDEPGVYKRLKKALEKRCALLELATSAEEAEALRLRYHFDVLVVEIQLPGLSGLDWLTKLRERGIRTHVIYMTAAGDLGMAVAALRNGADDFIMKPFGTEQMLMSIRRTLTRGQILRENSLLRLQLQHIQTDDSFIGQCPPVKHMLEQARQWATSSSCVLITGESGTGKCVLATTLHTMSRRPGALIVVSCGALQAGNEAGELFGKDGLFMHANHGTLVLMDVELLSHASQARVLHVLEHKTLHPAERDRQNALEVRVIATTGADLLQLIDAGNFRRDLQLRFSTLPLHIPPLRERGQDVQLLADTFMQRLSTRLGLAPVELLHAHRHTLAAYQWPGNVRELRNVIEQTLLSGNLPAESFAIDDTTEKHWVGPGYPLDQDLASVERAHIEAVLEAQKNNKSAAARVLGVSRKTLERKQALWYGDDDNQ